MFETDPNLTGSSPESEQFSLGIRQSAIVTADVLRLRSRIDELAPIKDVVLELDAISAPEFTHPSLESVTGYVEGSLLTSSARKYPLRYNRVSRDLLKEVFPPEVVNVEGKYIGTTSFLSPNAFWRDSFPTAAAGDAEYLKVKQKTKESAEQALKDNALPAPSLLPADRDKRIAEAFTNRMAQLEISITAIRNLVEENIVQQSVDESRLIAAFARLRGLPPQPVYFNAESRTIVDSVARELRRLKVQLGKYIANPIEYIAKQVIQDVQDSFDTQLTTVVDEKVHAVLSQELEAFAIALAERKSIATQSNVPSQTKVSTTSQEADLLAVQTPVFDQSPNATLSQKDKTEKPDPIDTVVLELPWIEPESQIFAVEHHTTDSGDEVYFIDAQSKNAADLSLSIAQSNARARKQFETHKLRAIDYVASGNISALDVLRAATEISEEYKALTIYYLKVLSPNAPRTYIAVLPDEYRTAFAEQAGYKNVENLPSVVLLLGQCDKKHQEELLSEFYDKATRATLRSRGAGSI